MKKKFLLICIFCYFAVQAQQQSLNVSLLAHWNDSTLNRCDDDQIWNDLTGWRDTVNNREYLIAGSCDSIYFFDITNPHKLVKVDVEDGHSRNSVNRDYETYSHYVYCVSDRSSPVGSLQIFDLQYLPDSVHKVYDDDTYSINTHTLFIEAKSKRLYLCGNLHAPAGNRSMAIMSIANPEVPTFLGELSVGSACAYTHEVFVQNDTAFCSCGYAGLFVYDVTNPANPALITSITNYPNNGYNHSSWRDSSGQYLMFSDEVPFGLPIKIYDISDIKNPKNPVFFNSNYGATPHNAYWKGRFAWSSHYEDGVRAWDLSDPVNPKVAGYYDTYMKNTTGVYNGFHGCWGVYPFLPSGNIIASDISEGLFVLRPTATLGIADATVQYMQAGVYPNPFNDILHVSISSPDRTTAILQIFDMLGKTVVQRKVNLKSGENDFVIDEFNASKGLFIIQIKSDQFTWSNRIIKQ